MHTPIVTTAIAILISFVFSGCNEVENTLPVNYKINFAPINNSGVDGSATIVLEGNILQVRIEANGLEPLKEHPQHLHGFQGTASNSTCPPSPAFADTDGDGLVGIEEAKLYYGPIKLSLDTFPTASANGLITYEKSFTLGEGNIPELEELKTLQNRVLVLHGMTIDGTYKPAIPVACGQLRLSE